MIEISIILCTLNRAQALTQALESVAGAINGARFSDIEVIVVDNGSSDTTAQAIDAWKASMPFRVVALHEPRTGLAIARNAAILASCGKILVFTDDDCTLNPDYLICLRRHYAPGSGPALRGGKVELGDPADQPFSIKTDNEAAQLTDSLHPGGFVIGANMTFSREIIDTIGMFDERFGAGSVFKASEDTDFIYRAYKAGFPVAYVPDMAVKHFHGRKDTASVKRLNYGYQVGHGALYAKHLKDMRLIRHFYWDFRKCIAELTGQSVSGGSTGLSYASLISANIKGMLLYAACAILDRCHMKRIAGRP